jgi:hypothetical protein
MGSSSLGVRVVAESISGEIVADVVGVMAGFHVMFGKSLRSLCLNVAHGAAGVSPFIPDMVRISEEAQLALFEYLSHLLPEVDRFGEVFNFFDHGGWLLHRFVILVKP